MKWAKYQITAVVETVTIRVNEKVSKLKEKLKENFTPTSRQEEIIDDLNSLKELMDQQVNLENKINSLRNKINKNGRKEITQDIFPWNNVYNSNYVEERKNYFINELISKKLPSIPSYSDIERELTISTLSAGFDIEAWIEKFVNKVKCEE